MNPNSTMTPSPSVAPSDGRVVLEARNLVKSFPIRRDALGRVRERLRAVDDVDLTVQAGTTVGVVGESGSGKTSLGRLLARLIEPDSGSIRLDGVEYVGTRGSRLKPFRSKLQFIFQDAYGALNPTKPVGHAVAEPLLVHGLAKRRELHDRAVELLARVGLDESLAVRFPDELSGGQRQRVCIARALALEPRLLIADEPTSALDLSTRSGILNLLLDLQRETGQAIVLVSHDFATVRHLANHVAVMYLGRIVEEGPAQAVTTSPLHPYTQALLSAVPVPDPAVQRTRKRIRLIGEPPNPARPPSGCRFRTRCAFAIEDCARTVPPLRPFGDHKVACIRAGELPTI